jgi:hypothetical protein
LTGTRNRQLNNVSTMIPTYQDFPMLSHRFPHGRFPAAISALSEESNLQNMEDRLTTDGFLAEVKANLEAMLTYADCH